jgi:predicted kinase
MGDKSKVPAITVLCGLPGSGKTYYSYKHSRKNQIRLSSDEIRERVFGDISSQRFNGYVFSFMRLMAEKLVLAGCNVVIDSTNIKASYRKPWIDIGKRLGVPVTCVFINPALEECLKRNSQRDRRVPDDVIKKMYSQLEPPNIEEGFNKIIVP